jgi:glycosyltransferase involved in cell wall biosynthesis
MSQTPLVSVVIPAYNEADTVPDAIRSALAQSVTDLEVIVIDDGSEDDTAEAARSIADPRITVLTQHNQGVCVARNAGIAAARGTYVAFLDADDIWLPRKLERQLDYLDHHPDVTAVQAGVMFVDGDRNVLHVEPCRTSADPLMDTLMFKNLPAFPTTVMIRRDKLEQIGGFDTSLVILEDWNMAIEASRHCRLASIEEPLALYRVHPGNRSRDLSIHVEPGFIVLDRLFGDPSLPERVLARKRQIYARFFTMLAGGALRNRQWREWARWTTKALRTSPRTALYMAGLPARRLRRALSRRGEGVS